MELLNVLFPNLMQKLPEFYQAIIDTFVMVGISGVISFVLGIILGVALIVTKPGGILERREVYQFIDKAINTFRSIPFIILLTLLLPVTRMVVGTGIGVKGAIIPLVFGIVPFFSRQVESALTEIGTGVIEAAQAMGLSPWEVIFKVYLRESIAPLVRATTLTTISLIGLTAMAGAVGAGGLGDFAIRYGHNRFQEDVTMGTVIVLVAIVCLIQFLGNRLAARNTH